MRVALRDHDVAVPSEPLDLEGISPGLTQPCAERMPARMNHAILRELQRSTQSAELFDTIDRECDLDAYCNSCDKLLPWALYQIRELDGATLSEAPAAIAELLAELEGDSQIASA